MLSLLGIKLAFAGLWPLIADYGLGGLAIFACLAIGFFAGAIPKIGPFLGKLRMDFIWAAVVIAACMVWGGHMQRDEASRCVAKETIIVNEVHGAVAKTKTPAAKKAQDRFGRDDN